MLLIIYSLFSQNNQAWLERNQEKFGSRQVIHVISRCSITDSLSRRSFLLCTDSLSIAKLRSSSATWCSPKPRLQSACSGKAASWCAGPLASVFRCSIWLPVLFFYDHLIIVHSMAGPRQEDGWIACTVLPQLISKPPSPAPIFVLEPMQDPLNT